LPFGTHLARHAGDLGRERAELIHHGVDGVLQLEDLAPDVDGDLLGEVAVGDGRGDVGDVADLAGEVRGDGVDAVAEVPPAAALSPYPALFGALSFGTHLARDAGDLGREGAELVHHRVDGVLQLEDLAPDVDGDLLGKVAVGDGGGDVGDVADLAGEVRRHRVDAVGEVLPGAGHALDLGLAAELALGAHLPGHAGDLRGEARALVNHRVHA